VLDPVRLVIDNYPEGQEENCFAPNHPQRPELDKRALPFSRELWIERDDYQEDAPQGYFRLAPGAEVRLRFAYIVRCVGAEKDADGNVVAVHCTYDPATRSGTPGADARKVRGNIHWLSAAHALPAEVRLYDRLFAVPFPGMRRPPGASADGTAEPVAHATVVAGDDVDDDGAEPVERNWLDDLNPDSKRVITAYVEPALGSTAAGRSVPVRAARLFRRGSARPCARQACLQSHGDAQGFVGAAVALAARCDPRRLDRALAYAA
jgi:glutaminyl-tRNA synthetase